ncbi:MAG TPA: hypothetical protein VIW67_14460, partial [Terriglobales bacterium]
MQMLKVFVVAHRVADGGAGQHVECSSLDVNDRSGGDADFRVKKRTLHHVSRRRNRAARFVEKTDLPQQSVAGAIGVECEDAVVFGGDIENVVRAVARNFYVGH